MRFRSLHSWDLTPGEALEVQRRLRSSVETVDRLSGPRTVAGVDVGFADRTTAVAAVAVLGFPGLETLEEVWVRRPVDFPYVPGLLSFREVPAVLAALERLSRAPDLILCDAHGFAHPRRFGLACHLGLVTDRPAVGVAKSRLVGRHRDPASERGSRCDLVDGDEVIGAVVRTRTAVRPVYVSVGHRVGLDTAVDLVLRCTTRYRLPEPTRRADRLASGRG